MNTHVFGRPLKVYLSLILLGLLVFGNVVVETHVASASTNQSLTMNSSMFGVSYLPGTDIFKNISNLRIEGSIANLTYPSGAVGIWEVDSSVGVKIWGHDLLLWDLGGNIITSLPLGSTTAFRFVGQRSMATGQYTLEVWDENGNYQIASAPSPSSATFDRSAPVYRMSIGSFYESERINAKLDFLRVHSTTRSLGGSPPDVSIATPADMLDFEFDGNLTDSSPNGMVFSFSSGTPAYSATASSPPSINVTSLPTTIRTNTPTQLNASGSYSNNGTPTLTYAWSQISGPATGSFSSASSANPTFTAPAFGLYQLRLTITDSSGQATSKDVEVGAVATDDNGIVSISDSKTSKTLGPLIRFGANPWDWEDDRNKKDADLLINSLDVYWNTNWFDTAAVGTVQATVGSATLTGSGTQFLSQVCVSGGNKSVILWYNSPDYPGTTGRGYYQVTGCTSNTQLSLNRSFGELVSGGTGSIQYSIVEKDNYYNWIVQGITASYYSNIGGLYSLYYRTGNTKYLTAARTFADRFWRMPAIDRGRVYWKFYNARDYDLGFFEMRSVDTLGLMLRAIEDPGMFVGLRHLWQAENNIYNVRAKGQASDGREMGYTLRIFAMCSQLEPDATQAANCRSYMAEIGRDNIAPNTPSASNGVMEALGQYGASFGGAAGYGSGSTVRVINGQTTVTAVTGNPGFDHSQTVGAQYMWFFKPGVSIPASNADGDSRIYKMNFPVTSASQIVLTEPYNNSSCPPPNGCVVGWANGNQYIGYGNQMYMLGMYAAGLDYARVAFQEAGDTANANLYYGFFNKAINFLMNDAYWPGTKGVYLARGFVACEPVGNDVPSGVLGNCKGLGPADARANLPEVMPGLMRAYLATGRSDIKNRLDELYTGVYGKPGYGVVAGQSTDSYYESGLDDNGYKMLATNGVWSIPQMTKWFGFHFGVGNAAGWPAIRLVTDFPFPDLDTTPPFLFNLTDSLVLPAGTASTTIFVTTNEPATCKYGLESAEYNLLSNTFTTTSSTSHSELIAGLENGSTVNYFIRCKDAHGNANSTDEVVSITVEEPINKAPEVNAGADKEIILPNLANLSGSYSDDGLPTDSVFAVNWTTQSGPGSVIFSNASSSTTTAAFSLPGSYTLNFSVSDGLLSSNDSVEVVVNQQPVPVIGSFTASQGTVTLGQSVTLSWNISGATTASINNGVGPITNLPIGTTVVSPSSTTSYMLTASNPGGSTSSSVTVIVNIPDTTPPTTPTGLSVQGISTSQIALAWLPSTDASGVVGYKVYRSTTSSGTLVQITTSTLTSYANIGLPANTTYYYAVAAYDLAGNISAKSAKVSGKTLFPDTTAPTLSSIQAGNLTATSSRISWTTNEAATSQVQYGLTSSYGAVTALDTSLVTSHTLSISGLAQNTVYHYRVRSKDATGNEAVSSDRTLTTLQLDTPPSAISNLRSTDTTRTTISLAWTAPGNNGNSGTASSYDIRYSLSPITETNWASASQANLEPVPKIAGSSQTYYLSSLSRNTRYYIAIKTKDTTNNWSVISNVISVTTRN